MGRRGQWGRNDPELPKLIPLNGPVIGAMRLGAPYHEEGVIGRGGASERWRLTDDINALLLPDDEFVMGSTLMEVKEALEARWPSPVGGVSMIEICSNDQDLKRHKLPFADSAISEMKKNPNWSEYHRWGDEYVKRWSPDAVATLTRLCAAGDDLLISVEAEQHIRSDDDFDDSDLVIGKRDSWYSVVKYRPTKAAARRKSRGTITKKEAHAKSLVTASYGLRAAAADAYVGLREELEESGVNVVVAQVSQLHRGYYRDAYSDPDSKKIIRQLRALLVLHAALRGRHTYRHNNAWQEFLKVIRGRPKDLENDDWGNYSDVREWLAAECLVRRPKPGMLRGARPRDADPVTEKRGA